MNDWLQLAFHCMWVLGASLGVAVLAITFGQFTPGGKGYWSRLCQPQAQAGFGLAFFFVCTGQAGLAAASWELIFWLLLACAFGVFAVRDLALWRKSGKIYSTQKVDENQTNQQEC